MLHNRLSVTDSTYLHEHKEIADCLVRHRVPGVTLERLEHLAATKIQARYRGYRIRKNFNKHRALLIR